MHIKFSHLTKVTTERKLLHILLLTSICLIFLSFVVLSWTGLWLYSPTISEDIPSLDLTGKYMGLYVFNSLNNYSLAWYSWLILAMDVVGFALFAVVLSLEHTWKFKLSNHQITYFNVYPLYTFTLIFTILMFSSVPHMYQINPKGGGTIISWESIFSYYKFDTTPDGTYRFLEYLTVGGVLMTIIGWLLLIYQVKVTAAWICEVKDKWGHNMHTNKFDFTNFDQQKDAYQKIFFKKKALAFKLTWIDMIVTTAIAVMFLVLCETVPGLIDLLDDREAIYIPYIFIPLIWFFFIAIDTCMLFYLHYTKKNDQKQHWFDILAIIFGGTVASCGGIILLTDWWYEYNHIVHHAKKEGEILDL